MMLFIGGYQLSNHRSSSSIKSIDPLLVFERRNEKLSTLFDFYRMRNFLPASTSVIRGQAQQNAEDWSLPPVQEYIESALDREKSLVSKLSEQQREHRYLSPKKHQLDLA